MRLAAGISTPRATATARRAASRVSSGIWPTEPPGSGNPQARLIFASVRVVRIEASGFFMNLVIVDGEILAARARPVKSVPRASAARSMKAWTRSRSLVIAALINADSGPESPVARLLLTCMQFCK